MELLVSRDLFTEDASIGKLFIEDQYQCETLEDKYREVAGEPVAEWKVKGKTAIPIGRYSVVLLESPRFGFVTPHLLGVPGFSEIEMHPGNTSSDTEGCILVGTQRLDDGISESRIAFGALIAKLSNVKEPLWLTVC